MAADDAYRIGLGPTVDLPDLRDRRWVGRKAEAQLIAELLHALDHDGEGALLEVCGAPGIGKSRLLRELQARAAARGHVVLWGKAGQFEAEYPFGLFADAMEDWLHRMEPKRLQRLAGDIGVHLSIVLPALERLAEDHSAESQQERYRAYRSIRELLSSVAADSPVALVLDDVHWADPASIELVCHLLSHPPRGPVLIALSVRSGQVPPRLRSALSAAQRDHNARRLQLGPLDRGAARELLGAEVPDGRFDQLYQECGGNPFFLLELSRTAGLPVESEPGAFSHRSSVPEPVRAVLGGQFSSLSEPSLMLLRGGAVTGDPFEVALAATVADVGEADVGDLIDELVQSQILAPYTIDGRLGFRHPIVRSAVYESTEGRWRRRAHGRLAGLLADRGATSSAQAPHIERSAARGDATAISILVDAAKANGSRAPMLAARWYGAALRLLPEGPQAELQRVELMIAMATALGGAGQLEASRRTLNEVFDLLAPTDPAWVPVVASCAGVEHLLGRHRAADARLQRALDVLEDRDGLDGVRLVIELAAGGGYENRYEDMLRWAQEAFEGARRLDQRALAVVAGGQIALAQYFLGRPAGDAMNWAAEAADDLEDSELAQRLDIGLWVGWTEAVLERHGRAVAHCQRVIDVSRATGQGAVLLVTMTAQAWSLIRLGRLADAEELLAGAIEAGYLAPNLFLSVAVGQSALVATCQGRYDAAARAGEESVRLARGADPGLIPGMSGLYHAMPLIEMGRCRQAREVILAMSNGDPGLQTSRSGYAAAYEVLTRAELGLRNIEAAREWARRAEDVAGEGELVAETAHARRATAAVALAGGEPERAAKIALDAAERSEQAGLPIEAGRCRIVGARALAEAGHKQQAIAELERAAQGLAGVGASGYRAQAERELRRLGRQTRPASVPATPSLERTRPGNAVGDAWAPLTRGERAVVALVADGLTNPEVAERLYLSPHTVKRHLANAMRKLRVGSRRQLRTLVRSSTMGPA